MTENITQPVEQFIERAEEACHEAREWVEREIREPIERRRERTERRCRRRSCNWWCACCNKWFCWLETIIEIIVEWVVKVVGEWLVETVCEIVVKVVKIVVEVVFAVIKFVVTFVVCLFTDPLAALISIADLWMDVLSIIDDIGDLVTGIVDDVSDLLDLTKDSILDLGDNLGPVGRFFLGIVAGVLDIIRGVVDGLARVIEGVFEIVGGILSLDFCRALEGLTKGVLLGVAQAVTNALGVLSLGSRGAIDGIELDSLRSWLQEELVSKFEGDRLEELEDKLGMDSSSFGTQWNVFPFICSISSRSPHLDLRDMHGNDTINLYDIAGYAPIWCEKVISRNIYRLVYTGTDHRVSIGDIRAYLSGSDNDVPEFQLLAGDKDTLRDMLKVAERKFEKIAIFLDWDIIRTFEIESLDEMLVTAQTVDANGNVIDPEGGHGRIMVRMSNQFGLGDICDLPAGFVFGYADGNLGLSTPYWRGEKRVTTGASVRPGVMTHVYGTILAHEMGHCFSLCHSGHDGLEHIMFTMADNSNNCGITNPDILAEHGIETGGDLEVVTEATVINYLMVHGEPVFTLNDGKNAWRWIINEAIECI
ncbi:MAG: hypothetical protein KBT53_00800 [Porticoccus sp.]|nr:hypothetical protein [Porticoccus sp.]MBQ0806375.1 hypothetical protein [Porticoccus sp.]MDX2350310.1 hypothetical protein [Porticoccus sp.]